MEATAMKFALVMGLVLALAIGNLNVALGQCSGDPVLKLVPCLNAAKDPNVSVPEKCCDNIKSMVQNPQCLCDAMLSDAAKRGGVKPEVAITIPKRCNIAKRAQGYKCGPYTLP